MLLPANPVRAMRARIEWRVDQLDQKMDARFSEVDERMRGMEETLRAIQRQMGAVLEVAARGHAGDADPPGAKKSRTH